MNQRLVEAACWRIWYRLKERGPCTGKNLMANCGISGDVFEESMSQLIHMGQVKEIDGNRIWSEQRFGLRDTQPRMMQVYATLWSDE